LDTSIGAVLSLHSDTRHTVNCVSAGSGKTAPDYVRFCLDCGGSMVTKAVHGTDRRVCVDCARVHYADPKIAVGVAVFRDDALLLDRKSVV